MAFKGNIPSGSRVRATLSVEQGAQGTALVALAFVDNDGGQGADSTTVAPGATDRVSVETNSGPTGILRVVIDFNSNFDNGRLTVHVDGMERNDEPITGDTTWSYSLT